MTKDEALRLALEALECWQRNVDCNEPMSKIMGAIKAALEAKDEPVACSMCNEWEKVCDQHLRYINKLKKKRTWVGLTDAQCGVLWKINMTPFDYYQAIEAKLKDKNI